MWDGHVHVRWACACAMASLIKEQLSYEEHLKECGLAIEVLNIWL